MCNTLVSCPVETLDSRTETLDSPAEAPSVAVSPAKAPSCCFFSGRCSCRTVDSPAEALARRSPKDAGVDDVLAVSAGDGVGDVLAIAAEGGAYDVLAIAAEGGA
jgi:hypothetical protein